MSVTFFDLKPKKQVDLKNTPSKTKVELVHHVIESKPAMMTYLENGETKLVEGDFTRRSDGSYVLIRTTVEQHPIYEKTEMTYKDVDAHFSYLDSKGEKRTFNNMETLQYDQETNTYTGVVEETIYDTTEVEVFEEK